MRKFALLMVVSLLLGMVFSTAAADGAAMAYVDGREADRVHLRAGAGMAYASLGLYFTGTPVTCLSDLNAEWVRVRIGAATGYMMARYLTTELVTPRQPTGTVNVKEGDAISIYWVPQERTELAGVALSTEQMTVLGETADGWYDVQYGEVRGYARADLLRLEEKESMNAVIDGKTSDRVHLRAGAGTEYDSLGLYFTGTPVTCLTDLNAEWVQVRIGAATGYMMSQYLTTEAVAPRQPTGTVNVKEGDAISIYWVPQERTELAGVALSTERMTVLGETADGWYYVRAGDVYGYVAAQYLTVAMKPEKSQVSPSCGFNL